MTHFKNVCKHGIVISQCRCPFPNKETRLVGCWHDDPIPGQPLLPPPVPPPLPENVRPDRDELLYDAWTVIANAPRGWEDDNEWRRAAIIWRNRFHKTLKEQ